MVLLEIVVEMYSATYMTMLEIWQYFSGTQKKHYFFLNCVIFVEWHSSKVPAPLCYSGFSLTQLMFLHAGRRPSVTRNFSSTCWPRSIFPPWSIRNHVDTFVVVSSKAVSRSDWLLCIALSLNNEVLKLVCILMITACLERGNEGIYQTENQDKERKSM